MAPYMAARPRVVDPQSGGDIAFPVLSFAEVECGPFQYHPPYAGSPLSAASLALGEVVRA
jgi:hypothetical protein